MQFKIQKAPLRPIQDDKRQMVLATDVKKKSEDRKKKEDCAAQNL